MAGANDDPGRPAIRLFGSLTINHGARTLGARHLGGTRPKQVLQILLAARGHRVSTDRLADLLWGERLPQHAAGSLQTFVSVLRRHLDPDRERARELVVTEAEAYRFATELIELDLDRFDELLERSAHAPSHVARRCLEDALALARGDVLEDEPYAVWAEELRGTYRGRVLGARLDAADAALSECDYAAAFSHTEAAAGLDRFSERAYRTRMLALYALGRQHEALETYRRLRALLADELGLEPTAETKALEAAILRQEDVRLLLPRPTGSAQALTGERSLRLLGRTAELDTLERAVREALDGSFALVLVEGETGLGKTRLLDELVEMLPLVRIGRASCSELERHLPYVPLAAAVREALAEIELEPSCRPALRRILPELGLAENPHEFAEVDGLEALVELIREHAPLVLVLDDLQWADVATLAAIGYIQRRCAGVPAAVVATFRSEEAAADDPLRSLRANTVVRLEPLTTTELAPLGMPDLHDTTGGNPRFVTAAIANGTRREFAAALADALLAQCRSEGPWAYRVLVGACVLEQPFEPEPLATLLDVDPTQVIEELERLCQRRILRVDGLRFGFRYDLVREALLASLSPARQRLLRERLDDRTPIPTGRVARRAEG